ncbi:hypothetical protein CCONF_08975 [Corynebacterium confusum]|nr:hypothetical protein CCONF_08975 [Corynebacterium confusum]
MHNCKPGTQALAPIVAHLGTRFFPHLPERAEIRAMLA